MSTEEEEPPLVSEDEVEESTEELEGDPSESLPEATEADNKVEVVDEITIEENVTEDETEE